MTAASVQRSGRAYRVMFRHKGKQQSRSFKDEKSAEWWAAVVRAAGAEAALDSLNEEADSQRIVTLDEALDAHLAELVVKPGTLDEYRKLARRTWQPTLGPLPVHAISKARLVAWVRQAHEVEGRSPKTISNAHGLLSGVLNTAVDHGWIVANPCRGVRMPTGEKREKVWLSEQEGADLISAMPDYWRPFVVLIASTGMRLGEVTALQWGDVDWAASTVRVARGWHKVGGRYVLSAPKTSRSRRTIHLPPVAVAALRAVQARQPDDGRDAIIFRGERGGTRVHAAWFRTNIWHPARERAGISKNATPHSLRDSHVAWLVSRGTHLMVIQRRLGHESSTTTEANYGHLQPDVLSASVDAAQDALRALTSAKG